MENEPIKIDKWDGSALKNTLDDYCKTVLIDKYDYKECHRLMDMRLAICTAAVGCALFALLYDYLHPFPSSTFVLTVCSASYFVLMGILTLYTSFVEKGIFLVAKNVDKAGVDPTQVLTVSSCLKRFDDKYSLCFEYNNGKKGARIQTATMEKSVASWFDTEGYLVQEAFEKDVSALHESVLRKKNS